MIITSPEGKWIYNLDEDRDIEITGTLGTTHIRIHDGKASFIQSPCNNHTCMQAPPVSKGGDWAACLPNQVFVYAEGQNIQDNKDFDAVGF